MLRSAASSASLPAVAASRRACRADAQQRPLQVGGGVRRCDTRNPHAFAFASRRCTRVGCLAATSGQASEQSIYAEDGPHGRYFEAVVTDFIRTRSGAVLKLLCTPRCAGLNAEQRCAPS
jgi:hypothetical protein